MCEDCSRAKSSERKSLSVNISCDLSSWTSSDWCETESGQHRSRTRMSSSLNVNYTIVSIHFRSRIAEKDDAFVAFLASRALWSANQFHRKLCGSLWFFSVERFMICGRELSGWEAFGTDQNDASGYTKRRVTNVECKIAINFLFRLCMSRSFAKFNVNTRVLQTYEGCRDLGLLRSHRCGRFNWIYIFN